MPANSGALITPDRYLFLCALQHCAPDFWQGLKRSTDYGTPFECWAERAGVVDDWLIEVLRMTVTRWREHPEHPGSQLREGYEWFAYPKDNPVVPFAPQFTDPYPKLFSGVFSDPDLNTAQSITQRAAIRKTRDIETPEAFARRMTVQFNKALTDHKKYLRQSIPDNDIRERRTAHAEWTALAIFGQKTDGSPITVAEIVERWPDVGDYSTVHKAVSRFASDIRLTLLRTQLDKS